MALFKQHPCPTCGELHMGKRADCWRCEREKALALHPARTCALCGDVIPREKGRCHSDYCSLHCATVVAKARGQVAQVVSKELSSGRLVPAKTLTCVDCGKPAFDYDHREYLKPLEVVPVCRSCNIKRGAADDIRPFVAAFLGLAVEDMVACVRSYSAAMSEWHRRFFSKEPRGETPRIESIAERYRRCAFERAH